MASYFITGKQGNGKSLIAVGKMFEYLSRGCKVATNLDIFLDKYLSVQSKKSVIRIPDKPTIFEFEALGYANTSYDEEKNGLLVLDELGSWFNCRSWNDKERKPLIEWFLYLRKRGWDVFLLVQDIDMVDGQLRGMLGEHLVCCRRLDRVKIPFIGGFLKFLGAKGTLPKIHRAKVYFGESEQDMHVDTWTYRGTDFYPAYDTKQVFSSVYPHGIHSVLSPWHTKGRYLPAALPIKERIKKAATVALDAYLNPPVPHFPPKPKHPLVARLEKLPESTRLEFFRRFDACGAFERGIPCA